MVFFPSDRLESRDCFIHQGLHRVRIDNFILLDPQSIYCLSLSRPRHPLFRFSSRKREFENEIVLSCKYLKIARDPIMT